jgi:hypothetical protein
MRFFFILNILSFLYIRLYSQHCDSIVYLKIDSYVIEYIKRYRIDEVINNDTFYTNYPMYILKDKNDIYIKTKKHKDYRYGIDPESGKTWIEDFKLSKQIIVKKQLGKISRDSITEILQKQIILINTNYIDSINNNYTIILCNKNRYLEIYRNSENWNMILEYEILNFKKDFYIIIDELFFYSESNQIIKLSAFYWEIKD